MTCNRLRKRALLPAGLLALAMSLVGMAFAGPDSDCTMCHGEAPIPASHMPVDEVSVESCTMCHEASSEDPFFRILHEKHGDALGCDSCHSDASEESKARLKEMLGG